MKPLIVQNTRPRGAPLKHSLELKISIARKVMEDNQSQSLLAKETGYSFTNVHKWVSQARRGELHGYTAPVFDADTGDPSAEIRRLRLALVDTTQQRDFLKKKSAYFAKGQS